MEILPSLLVIMDLALIEEIELLCQLVGRLLALIKATEGKIEARMWLKAKFPLLYCLALAADGENEEMEKLIKKDRLMAGIAQKIKFVKDQIEEANNDVHRWGYD